MVMREVMKEVEVGHDETSTVKRTLDLSKITDRRSE